MLNFVVKNPNKIFICIRRLLHSEKLLPQGRPCLQLQCYGESSYSPRMFSVLRSRPEADDSLIGGMYRLLIYGGSSSESAIAGYFLLSSFRSDASLSLANSEVNRYRAVFKSIF